MPLRENTSMIDIHRRWFSIHEIYIVWTNRALDLSETDLCIRVWMSIKPQKPYWCTTNRSLSFLAVITIYVNMGYQKITANDTPFIMNGPSWLWGWPDVSIRNAIYCFKIEALTCSSQYFGCLYIMSLHMPSKMWDEMTSPFPNDTIEVGNGSHFISYFKMNAVIVVHSLY